MARYNKTRSCGGYHGRRGTATQRFLKGVIIALLVLVALLAAARFALGEDLVLYDGDGFHFPWGNGADREDPQPDDSPSPSLPLIIEEEDDPAVPGEDEPLHAVLVSSAALAGGTVEQAVAAAGGNAAILDMKLADGMLNFVSSHALAVAAGASSADPGANSAIAQLTGGELYTIARVSCFKDALLPVYDETLAIHTNSGYRWSDYDGVRWTSPANETVVEYLVALCVELAQLGFDEICLTDCGYPTAGDGNLGWIKAGEAYPKGALDTVILPFLTRVKEALEPYGVKLSVEAMGCELTGETDKTGLTAAVVLACCDHIWVDAVDAVGYGDFTDLEDGAALSERLVTVSASAGDGDRSWAILS